MDEEASIMMKQNSTKLLSQLIGARRWRGEREGGCVVGDLPASLLEDTSVFASVGVLLAHCFLWSQMTTAWIPLKLQKRLH